MSMSQVAVDQETSAKIFEIVVSAVLRDVRESIDAIGGAKNTDEFDRGVNYAVTKALAIIDAKKAGASRS
ncbi:MAG: hypothetical protein JWL86_624 [Rhizobium sp.]|nr:hypothetical protein [Rhizobium sp.]